MNILTINYAFPDEKIDISTIYGTVSVEMVNRILEPYIPPESEIEKIYKLVIRAESESKAKLLYNKFHTDKFLVGEPFEAKIYIKNISSSTFPGGTLNIFFVWPVGQLVIKKLEIPEIKPEEEILLGAIIEKSMTPGYGLLYATAFLNNGKPVEIFLPDGKRKAYKVSFHQILAKTHEEIYQYWSVLISAFSLITMLILYIIDLILR